MRPKREQKERIADRPTPSARRIGHGKPQKDDLGSHPDPRTCQPLLRSRLYTVRELKCEVSPPDNVPLRGAHGITFDYVCDEISVKQL